MIRILRNFQLKNLTTFGTGGVGRSVYFLRSSDLPIVLGEIDDFVILGNGSNVIFSDEYFSKNILYVVPLSSFKGINIVSDLLEVDANISSSALSWWCARKGISGFEFAAGIPGRIGACIFGNAGCFGSDFSKNLKSIFVFDCISKTFIEIDSGNIQFSYRKSSIKNKVILKAYFETSFNKPESVFARTLELLNKKKLSQPHGIKTFGSIFRNPPGNWAGKLLDSLGFRGYKLGGVMVSEKHANFLENIGGSTSDAVKIIKLMQDKVLERYNILLEPEVRFLGEFKELPILSGDEL
ncbi:MAG TPA: UDP-N-acetylmuramate dehydrogenase [Thermodesulfobium narugense]|nr:MAG: UDP-N-acetylenolpyruvoylglucosamine reductase [Thermodesulfobium narugense]HEM56509.1 UDP-N-acetylmuramate dehydrogenase [Thermodesulfobium narugense]